MFDKISVIRPICPVTPARKVPITCELVPAGFPSPAQDYFDGDVDLNEHLISNRPATFVVRVAGDSMMNAGIWDGDEVIVDRAIEPKDGDIVIAVVDQELTIKRLKITHDGAELHPENPKYPIIYPHELEVWGVVTVCLHKVRSAGM